MFSQPLQIPRKLLHSSICVLVTFIWLHHPNVVLAIRSMFLCLLIVAGADFIRFQDPKFEATVRGLAVILTRARS